MRLKDRSIVITGGATGIGRATALRCAGEGAQVVVVDINETDGRSVEEQVRAAGGQGWFVRTDVTDAVQVASAMETAAGHMGGVNGLVAAAGVLHESLVPVDEIPLDEWDLTISVNLRGAFLATKHAVPAMKRAGSGVIVLIASGAGVKGGSSDVAYGSSKGGVNGLGMTLERHLAPDGIRVNVVCPGNISTPLKLGAIEQQVERVGEAADRERQMAGLGSPDGVARLLAFLLSDEADYVRGALFTR
jgi:NAD(P)-dependent dehydrogenase (short-subunit alcohol dehydrogenase family)